VALLAEVTPQGLHLQLNFWIEDAATGQGLARSEVNLAAVRALREAGLALVHAPSEATAARPGAPSAP
jgi:hypothetical protein